MLDRIEENNNTFKIMAKNRKSASFHLEDSQRERLANLLK